MLKQRLIFTLLFDQGKYQLSRNFRLQEVGDLEWLRDNYDFDSIAHSIDELIVLNVTRDESSISQFSDGLAELSQHYFLPVAAGGGIRSLEDAHALLRSNADKLVINTPLFKDADLVRAMADTLGSQCVVASIDYQKRGNSYQVITERGSEVTGMSLRKAVEWVQELGAGEIYLTSVDKDGTGFGYETEFYEEILDICNVPLIMSGGVGKSEHFVEGLSLPGVTGVSTANIYNFMVDGLSSARSHIEMSGIPMAQWDELTLTDNSNNH
jgi:imidazole glycerol-phosphate synthase subunit HisF